LPLLSNGERHSRSHCCRAHVIRLRNLTSQRISESQCGPYATVMTDEGQWRFDSSNLHSSF
jgi:hypothetical protein